MPVPIVMKMAFAYSNNSPKKKKKKKEVFLKFFCPFFRFHGSVRKMTFYMY